MIEGIEDKLRQLGVLLTRLRPAFWSAQEAIEHGSAVDEAHARWVLANACEAIDQFARVGITHLSTPGAVAKSHPIAHQPGMSLLPAPSNPAVERWQQTAPDPSNPAAVPSELVTAGHQAVVVKPASDYEAFLAKQLSVGTRKAYDSAMRHFIDAVGLKSPLELLSVGPEILIAYRNAQIDAGAAPATIARRLSTLRSFFSMMVTLGRILKNPADAKLVRSPRVPRDGVTVGIEAHEARKMLKSPDTSTLIGKRDRAILAVGLYMGLRREELATLNIGDVRSERGHQVLEVRGKGGKTRVLAIPPAAYSAVREYLQASERTAAADTEPLFASLGHAAGEAGRISGRDVWNIVKKHAVAAGVNHEISPHSMRVAAITSALDHGAPIARVQIMAGHADPRTTTRYFRAGEDLDESATYAVRY